MSTPRPLGTMVTAGYPRVGPDVDLLIAQRIGASVVEILPFWRQPPPASECLARVRDSGMTVHSVHGCWGSQAIRADRVDLSHPDPEVRTQSLDDLRSALDWAVEVGARHLVVHPGSLSDPDEIELRSNLLAESLSRLADHLPDRPRLICVENMPPGVHPGSRMSDLVDLLRTLDRVELGLALDTGHAALVSSPDDQAQVAGNLLATLHVHDNNGRQDLHLPPGRGVIDWPLWTSKLDALGFIGPIMLECIRQLRELPESIDDAFLERLAMLTGRDFDSITTLA